METGIRGSAAGLARVAGSTLARAATGLPGTIAGMVFDAGDRAAGETAATTRARQQNFAESFRDSVNREAGRIVISGETTEEILDSIAAYRARAGR